MFYIAISGGQDKPVLMIRPDGRIEIGEGCTNAEGAQALVDAANVLRAQNGAQPAHVPDGFVLVPYDPDGRMLLAGNRAGGQNVSCGRIWRAMIDQFLKSGGGA